MIKRNANVNVKNQKALRRLLLLAALVLVCGGFVCWGFAVGVGALREVWREQFRVQDSAIDVVVTSSGKNVTPATIVYYFGLTNGANLATIPYDELRKSLIARIPNIHDISIERRLPRRVTVDVKEREPAVRIAPPKGASDSGGCQSSGSRAKSATRPATGWRAMRVPRSSTCISSPKSPTASRTPRPRLPTCASSSSTRRRRTTCS